MKKISAFEILRKCRWPFTNKKTRTDSIILKGIILCELLNDPFFVRRKLLYPTTSMCHPISEPWLRLCRLYRGTGKRYVSFLRTYRHKWYLFQLTDEVEDKLESNEYVTIMPVGIHVVDISGWSCGFIHIQICALVIGYPVLSLNNLGDLLVRFCRISRKNSDVFCVLSLQAEPLIYAFL